MRRRKVHIGRLTITAPKQRPLAPPAPNTADEVGQSGDDAGGDDRGNQLPRRELGAERPNVRLEPISRLTDVARNFCRVLAVGAPAVQRLRSDATRHAGAHVWSLFTLRARCTRTNAPSRITMPTLKAASHATTPIAMRPRINAAKRTSSPAYARTPAPANSPACLARPAAFSFSSALASAIS